MNSSTALPTTVNWNGVFDDVLRNDLESVKRRVEEEHFPLNQTNSDGETVAHTAIKQGNLAMLKYFLAKKPELLVARDKWDQTVLTLALDKGAMKIIRYLVDEVKADIYYQHLQRFGNMAIHIAAEEGQMEVLKYLVEEKKVDVNILNFLKEPPLFLAAGKPHMDIIRYFVEKTDANVTALDSINDNILYISAMKGDLQVPKYLLEERKIHFDINWQDQFGRSIVYVASRFNQIEFLKYCVEEKGADPHLPNNKGWTPLFEASYHGNVETMKYLISKGADVNHKDDANQTIIQWAEKSVIGLLNKTKHERGRRSILKPTVYVPSLTKDESQVIHGQMILAESTDLSFRNSNVGASKLQSFLLILNAFFRYPRDLQNWNQQDALLTPEDTIRARMDHVAVDAIRQLPPNL